MRKIRVGNDFFVVWEIKEQGVLVDLIRVKDTIKITAKVGDNCFEIPKNLIDILEDGLIRIEVKTELFKCIGRYELALSYSHHDTSMSDDDRKRQTNFTPFAIVPKTELADAVEDIPITSDILIGLKGETGKSAYLYYKENTTDEPILTEQEFADKLAVIPSNENDRINAESTRVSNENERISNEVARKSNEVERKSNEATRISDEATREANEIERKLNEAGRVNAESDRVASEQTREQQEVERQNNTAVAITNAENAITDVNAAKDDYYDVVKPAIQAQGVYAQAQGDYAKAQGDIVAGYTLITSIEGTQEFNEINIV